MTDLDLSVVILEMSELVKKFGKDKALQILDCCEAIHEATKDFSDDVKDDAIKWVMDIARKSK